MIITLSPSKGQDFETSCLTRKYSRPADVKDSELLIKALRKIKAPALQALMDVSSNIAELNVGRYQSFSTPFTPKNARQAICAFKGDVYGGFDLAHFTPEDFDYAQDHLRILSGLYGCLRPLDLIQPYRLEMKTKLKNHQVEAAIRAAEDRGDFSVFHDLHAVLQAPFTWQAGKERYMLPPEPSEEVKQTFCGT